MEKGCASSRRNWGLSASSGRKRGLVASSRRNWGSVAMRKHMERGASTALHEQNEKEFECVEQTEKGQRGLLGYTSG